MSGGIDDLEEAYNPGPPYATITKVGRWRHSIEIHQGLMCWNGWPGGAWGRKGAERKARRVLAKLMREEQCRSEAVEVRL